MDLSKHQEELLFSLKMAVKRHCTNEVVYKSEWLGYLPYGQYCWLEVDGEGIELSSPDTLDDDLSALIKLGVLQLIKEVQVGDEGGHIYYELRAK